ncbi:MAG: ankyrin repeat domain-containing protein, partial [Cyanobacteria bacterium P01_A01_bin.40]
ELFGREAEVLSKLDHPAIPKYIDYFDLETDTDKAFYIVQQQAPGKSLFDLVQSGWRITEAQVKDIAQQILAILSYLHSLDPPVIHRDIKPNNLIRSDDGKIYLVDFGAVQNTYYNTLMQGSTVVGTYGYMAPEQFRGQALPATDLYSLGATLLYLLTHRSPAELPQDTLKLDFRNSVDISESFADWLDKILEPDIEDRFADANEALTQLFASKRKKPGKLVKSFTAGILAAGLITGFNSYKWFFLSGLGFSPDNLCSPTVLHNFLKEGGNINFLADSKIANFLFCTLENQKIETKYLQKVFNKISNNSIKESDITYDYLRRNQSLIHAAIIEQRYEIISSLIDIGADVNYEVRYTHTPIFRAISHGRLDIAQLLIDNGANINIEDNTGEHLVFYALYYGSIESVRLLIENNAYVDVKNKRGDTLLILAINGNHIELAKSLIANGANVNLKRESGETPLFHAIDQNKLELVKLLIDNGANPNLKNDKTYFKDKPDIAKFNSEKLPLFNNKINYEIAKLLIENGAAIDTKDKSGHTSLFFYSKLGNKYIVEDLIKLGANVNTKDRYGRTPLFYAKNKNVVKLLVNNGANVNVEDIIGRTPLFEVEDKDTTQLIIDKGADINHRDKRGNTPLFGARNLQIAQLLINNGADVHLRNRKGQTTLFGARNEDVVQLLIGLGVDPKIRDNYGRTPLFGIWNRNAAKLFIDLGIDINTKDNHGKTALFEAINPYIAKFLVDLGADINIKDNLGETALFNAVKKNYKYMVESLIEMDADINVINHNGQTPLFFAKPEISIILNKNGNNKT